MNRIVRRRLEMFNRARDFSRAHPSTDGNYTLVLELLDQGIARLEALAQQQENGRQISRSAVVNRQGIRRRLHEDLLPHLITVADAASAEAPALMARLQLPKSNVSNEVYRTLGRNLLEQGKAQVELLTKHGLATALLGDVEVALDAFDTSVAESNEGRREHVGARAELEAVSDQVMKLVERLDGLNRYRFAGNAELKAAWDSARRVVKGSRGAEQAPAPEPTAGGSAGAPPAGPSGGAPSSGGPADGVRPAA
jgi:hypothetical protein